MTLFIDQCNREVYIKKKPQRIISLVPSQTELLYDLGLDEEVVGITKFCIHPNVWFKNKKRIGGTKSVHLQKVKALNPDLIIANKEENSKKDIEELSKLFPVWISDIKSLSGAMEMIQHIGNICGRKLKAQEINKDIQAQFATLHPIKSNPSCLYMIWQKPYMLAGADTFINSMLRKCGFENYALDKIGRYPEFTEEEIYHSKVCFILLSSEPFPFKEKHLQKFQDKFPLSKAILVDGEMFSWYGSRLRLAPRYFNQLITSIGTVL